METMMLMVLLLNFVAISRSVLMNATRKQGFCAITPDHTLCKYERGREDEECGKVEVRGMSEDEKVMVMELHNTKRMRIANGLEKRGDPGPQPSASNMMEMTWDDEMETMAQVWTERCVVDHDCPDCRRSERSFAVGQNLYWFGHRSGSWKRSVEGWYNEVVHFNNSFVFPFYVVPGVLVGHFTQMVWAQTSMIGCGKLFYQRSGHRWGEQLFVCNYGTAGNLLRSEMYIEGDPCSACPEGTRCSDRYPGLCSGTPDSPLTVRPPLFPWEVPAGYPTVSNTTKVIAGFVDISDNPDAIIENFTVKPPNVTGSDVDRCVHTCRKDEGCTVAIETNRLIDGSVMGSCFPPSFGGSCSGTPEGCDTCLETCEGNHGTTIRVTTDGKRTVEKLREEGMEAEADAAKDSCHYNCGKHRGCTVRIKSERPINGNTLGSCFSAVFGGKCSGTPDRCQDCQDVCDETEEPTVVLKLDD